MDLLEIILKRRSVRNYTGESIPEEQINKILQAGLLAPTSQNRRPCKFYVIRNKATLKELSKAKKFGAGMLAECDTAIAVFADSRKADTWIEDCSIALSYMNLMATELGVGSCWCQLHLRSSLLGKDAEANARKLLRIENENMRIVGILALGMINENKTPSPHTLEDAEWDKVHYVE